MTTVADILRGRADSDATALLFGDDAWTYREVAEEAGRRAALFGELRDDGRPPHIGVLLENVPDYLFWLAAAALSGGVLVGINTNWLRVDGENFAAAPVEAIVGRHPDVRSVAVYAVPDDPVGDRVMVAIELRAGATFSPAAFDAFLSGQPDLGPKWLPSFVRVTGELPKLASMKVDKRRLRQEAWRAEPLFWRPARGERLRPLDDADRARLDRLID